MYNKKLLFSALIVLLCGAIVLFFMAFLQGYKYTNENVNIAKPVAPETPVTSETPTSAPKEITAIQFGNTTVAVSVASTMAEQEQGLSGKISLGATEGKLFVFQTSDTYGFWMKDMNFPLDIIWLDQDLNITYIAANLAPNSFPQVFKPTKKSLYVLEVNAGFAAAHNMKVGDQAKFSVL